MQYSLSPGPQSHFPTPHSSGLAKRLTSSVLPPADQKMKQNKGKERMLVQLFFFPAIFHAETMPLLKGEVDSTSHNSHSMPYWSQISHKITCYEKPQNILGNRVPASYFSCNFHTAFKQPNTNKEAVYVTAKSKDMHKKGL